MKALAYTTSHALADFALAPVDLPDPELRPGDLLVEVRALSTNPVDFKVRRSRNAPTGGHVVLGWDAAGVVRAVGADVRHFSPGDEVFYAGDLMRAGSYAELQAVDARVVAHKPKSLSFADAAALPLTSLTAWEALLERGFDYDENTTVLVLGGAGGVGSIATQLLKKKTNARVITTASRPETRAWCEALGADFVIDHRSDLRAELGRVGHPNVDIVFGTTHTDDYLPILPEILRPFGHLVLIDDPAALDVVPFKRKALSVHWELMFTKLLHDYRVESQGKILAEVAALVDAGALRTTRTTTFEGLTTENLKQAHTLGESSSAIGKIVITI